MPDTGQNAGNLSIVDSTTSLSLDETYFGLGSFSGIKISPLCLNSRYLSSDGGADYNDTPLLNKDDSTEILRTYMELGGNFIETSLQYGYGNSQRFVGSFVKEMLCREELVISAKVFGNYQKDEPKVSGCGKKSILRSLDLTLDRLKSNYVDLLWVDYWDRITPARELMRTLNQIVDNGNVLHLGLANMPAWYIAQCQQLALANGYETIIAVQADYNLCNRTADETYFDFCRQSGLSFMPSAPLADGYLSGSQHYMKEEHNLVKVEKNKQILNHLEKLSKEIQRPPAQIALSWSLRRPTVSSVLITPYTVDQLQSSVKCLDLKLTSKQLLGIDKVTLTREQQDKYKVHQLPPWWMQ